MNRMTDATPPMAKGALVVRVASLVCPNAPRDEYVDVGHPRVGAVEDKRSEHNAGHDREDAADLYSRQD